MMRQPIRAASASECQKTKRRISPSRPGCCVAAAETTLPVIGVPVDSSPLSGFDALLSTVQMPPGVPVATMGVGKSGATNAGILAVQIFALGDEKLAQKLREYKEELEKSVAYKSRNIEQQL